MAKAKEAAAAEAAPYAGPKYSVVVNNGNDGRREVRSLDDLAALAALFLVERGASQVTFLVRPVMVQGPLSAERADGVGVKKH